jgi:hypothetical protein
VQAPTPESTGPEQSNLLNIKFGLPPPQRRFPHFQPRNEAATELVIVHESGYSELDNASETSDESNDEDEEEGRWGYVGPSGSDAEQCSTSRGCAIPVGGDQPSLEKVSFHLDVL